MDMVVSQNPNLKIYFMQYESYYAFINNQITLIDVPIYIIEKINLKA